MSASVSIVLVVSFALYFLPSIIAWNSEKPNFLAIFVLNLFLGWTLVFWVLALVWSLYKTSEKK